VSGRSQSAVVYVFVLFYQWRNEPRVDLDFDGEGIILTSGVRDGLKDSVPPDLLQSVYRHGLPLIYRHITLEQHNNTRL
jgi:hypothetical protein